MLVMIAATVITADMISISVFAAYRNKLLTKHGLLDKKRVFSYNLAMEKKWKKRRERSARIRLFFKRIRIPLFVVTGSFLTAFILIPLSLGGFAYGAESIEIAPEPAATPGIAAIQPYDLDEPVVQPSAQPTDSSASAGIGMAAQASPEQTGQQGVDTNAYKTLSYDMRDEAVNALQQRLMDLYYMGSDETTDYFGHVTEAAVILFQRAHHLKESGQADAQTQAILYSDSAKSYVLNKGCSGDDVLTLQGELKELGYYDGKLNGYYGTATGRATAAFQKKNDLSITGEADYDTLELLYSPKAKPAIDPTPTPSPTPTPKPTKTPKPTRSPKPTKTPKPGSTPAQGWEVIETPEQTYYNYTQPPVNYGGGVSDFIALAKQQIGIRYVLGGKGPDKFDCSGFVYYCLKPLGKMSRYYNSSGMSQIDEWPTAYGKENLQPGDLIFYKSEGANTKVTHVAIWLGGNKLIHASASEGCVCITSWGGWSDRNFLFGKRVF